MYGEYWIIHDLFVLNIRRNLYSKCIGIENFIDPVNDTACVHHWYSYYGLWTSKYCIWLLRENGYIGLVKFCVYVKVIYISYKRFWWLIKIYATSCKHATTHPGLAGANGVAVGSSLARPRHRWWKGPIQIGCENFHRWRHYLKLVKIPWNFTYIFFDKNSTNFKMSHTLNSEWSHVKEDTKLSVYWTPLRHSLTSRACCVTRRHSTIWGSTL